ncbi:transposase [Streptomyces sp. NBC_00154]|uniref:IS110 family transposase n=1 Tax=Streptomyces sp. NBC_00154 TaxID=2975670 RepID=UPI002254B003|nr:transposase [Streptomyces sp. NBC_00154]MCX5317394.1 hypothetical protein [Streptomyces sp. NBC_00154]
MPVWAGLDIAKDFHWLAVLDERGKPLLNRRVDNDPESTASTVEALGEGVEGFAVGDAVFCVVMKPFLGTGSLAEYVTVSAAYGVAHVPAGLDVKDAGALGLAGTAAYDSLTALDVAEGETVIRRSRL